MHNCGGREMKSNYVITMAEMVFIYEDSINYNFSDSILWLLKIHLYQHGKIRLRLTYPQPLGTNR